MWSSFADLCLSLGTLQARFPLIQRVKPTATDATHGNATQAGGPFRFLLQANSTGSILFKMKCVTICMNSVPDKAVL